MQAVKQTGANGDCDDDDGDLLSPRSKKAKKTEKNKRKSKTRKSNKGAAEDDQITGEETDELSALKQRKPSSEGKRRSKKVKAE